MYYGCRNILLYDTLIVEIAEGIMDATLKKKV
jgi:hypothetical protein